jgi:hypothetical protein
MNKALLCKWLWKQIITIRYKNRRVLTYMTKFWKEVNKEQDIFNISITKKIGNETNTLFWEDRWLSKCAIKSHYLILFKLASNKNETIANDIGYNRFYLNSNRPLNDILRLHLNSLCTSLSTIVLNITEDIYLWSWSNSGLFSTHFCIIG